jgi:hypothetical protein
MKNHDTCPRAALTNIARRRVTVDCDSGAKMESNKEAGVAGVFERDEIRPNRPAICRIC